MKIRAGFVSNSSTASFIVKTRPTNWDVNIKKLGEDEIKSSTLSQEKIDLLKECGFFPSVETDPFAKEMGRIRAVTEDDAFLSFRIFCNCDYVLEFLVANNIPFKAAVHYGHFLYSYEMDDDYIYVLANFGVEYLQDPKRLERKIVELEEHVNIKPLQKIKKEDFLKDYNEETSLEIIKEK